MKNFVEKNIDAINLERARKMLKTPLVKLEAIYNHERFENKIRMKQSVEPLSEKGLKKE